MEDTQRSGIRIDPAQKGKEAAHDNYVADK
jgi:hypothetical protein